MMKRILPLLLILILVSSPALALFGAKAPPGLPHGAVCLKTGCVMQGNISMDGYTISDVIFVNASFMGNTSIIQNESDPVWIAEKSNYYTMIQIDELFTNMTSWVNDNFYNKSETYNKTEVNELIYNATSIKEVSTIITGNGTNTLPSINGDIYQIIVTPDLGNTNYRFELTEQSTSNLIDKNRREHTNVWDIRKRATVLNDGMVAEILNASNNANFNIVVRYR